MALFVSRSTRSTDTTGPTAPTIVASAASSSTVSIARTVPSTDDSGIGYYETQRSPTGAGAWTTFDSSSTNPLTAAGLSPGTTFDFRQRAIDTNGNVGTYSAISSATTQALIGDWADTYITNISSIGALMVTPGVRVGIRPTSLANVGQQLTSGNGASMSIVTNGSFDALESAVRIVPPSILVSGAGQYASWLRNLDIWNGGTINIPQLNVRWLNFFGSTYFQFSATTKVHAVFAQDSFSPSGGARRQAVWEDQNTGAWSPYKYWGTTSNSFQYYPGGGIDTFPDSSKLMQIGGSAVHGNSPPRVGNEWVCFESVVDLRQNRGNASGMNKLVMTTRDGVSRSIQSPANWDPAWSFTFQYVSGFEGLGFYWNNVGTADANNYVMHSHATFSPSMGINELIGPPPGFLL